jgi:hypothetical protein
LGGDEEGTVALATIIMMVGIILSMLSSIIPNPLAPPSPLTSLQAVAYTTPDNRLMVTITLQGLGAVKVVNVTLTPTGVGANCTLAKAYTNTTPTKPTPPWLINNHRSLTLVYIGITCQEVESVIIRFNNGVVLQAKPMG